MTPRTASSIAAASLGLFVASVHGQQPPPPQGDGFRFKSGIELINVTATVSDTNGHFVSGLQKNDFTVYEDDQPVEVTQFDAERVPVSLGIALDTSGSMVGEKMDAARAALNRLLVMLLDPDDEIFLYRFSNYPALIQGWTSDRQPLLRALERVVPNGGTAMYDTVVDAVPLIAQRTAAQEGAAHHLGRPRHVEHGHSGRRQTRHSRERSARLRDRHRLQHHGRAAPAG